MTWTEWNELDRLIAEICPGIYINDVGEICKVTDSGYTCKVSKEEDLIYRMNYSDEINYITELIDNRNKRISYVADIVKKRFKEEAEKIKDEDIINWLKYPANKIYNAGGYTTVRGTKL